MKPGVTVIDRVKDCRRSQYQRHGETPDTSQMAFTDLWVTTMSRNSDFRQVLRKMALLMRWVAQLRSTKMKRLPLPKARRKEKSENLS